MEPHQKLEFLSLGACSCCRLYSPGFSMEEFVTSRALPVITDANQRSSQNLFQSTGQKEAFSFGVRERSPSSAVTRDPFDGGSQVSYPFLGSSNRLGYQVSSIPSFQEDMQKNDGVSNDWTPPVVIDKTCPTILVPKRVRTMFTIEQLHRLENEFSRRQYVAGAQRLALARDLSLSERQVRVWFQNRRIKSRRQMTKNQQCR